MGSCQCAYDALALLHPRCGTLSTKCVSIGDVWHLHMQELTDSPTSLEPASSTAPEPSQEWAKIRELRRRAVPPRTSPVPCSVARVRIHPLIGPRHTHSRQMSASSH